MLADETLRRRAEAEATAFEAKTRALWVRLEHSIEADKAALQRCGSDVSVSKLTVGGWRRVAGCGVWLCGILVAVLAAGSWVRWIILNTNDPLLASLLAAMIPVTAVGLHYWVWRSRDRSRDRALAVITFALGVSGLGLLVAVAQRFGIEPPVSTDLGALLAGDDNRWVMIPCDLLGVCGSALLMAWAEDLCKSPFDRIGERLASKQAALQALKARSQKARDRALRRGIRILLGAYRKVV